MLLLPQPPSPQIVMVMRWSASMVGGVGLVRKGFEGRRFLEVGSKPL